MKGILLAWFINDSLKMPAGGEEVLKAGVDRRPTGVPKHDWKYPGAHPIYFTRRFRDCGVELISVSVYLCVCVCVCNSRIIIENHKGANGSLNLFVCTHCTRPVERTPASTQPCDTSSHRSRKSAEPILKMGPLNTAPAPPQSRLFPQKSPFWILICTSAFMSKNNSEKRANIKIVARRYKVVTSTCFMRRDEGANDGKKQKQLFKHFRWPGSSDFSNLSLPTNILLDFAVLIRPLVNFSLSERIIIIIKRRIFFITSR